MHRTIAFSLMFILYCHLLIAQIDNGKFPLVFPFENQEVTLTNSWIKEHESLNPNTCFHWIPKGYYTTSG